MNLLLFLSAFLTALTGVITGVRPVETAAQEQVFGHASLQQASVASVAASRPLQGWPALVRAPRPAQRALRLAAAFPVFGQRRRE